MNGKLDEPGWKRSSRRTFVNNVDGKKTTYKTEARMLRAHAVVNEFVTETSAIIIATSMSYAFAFSFNGVLLRVHVGAGAGSVHV